MSMRPGTASCSKRSFQTNRDGNKLDAPPHVTHLSRLLQQPQLAASYRQQRPVANIGSIAAVSQPLPAQPYKLLTWLPLHHHILHRARHPLCCNNTTLSCSCGSCGAAGCCLCLRHVSITP